MRLLNLKENSVYIADNLRHDLAELLQPFDNEKIFVLTDDNTFRCCINRITNVVGISSERVITIPSGDNNKNLNTVADVWKYLVTAKANRNSLLINLGGGMPCDLGGFAASIFKRGMPFINIPTTLLAQVDASVGGKTGINFMGLKNEIGIINQPEAVLLDAVFLETLNRENILSGFAEMIKHALLKGSNALEQIIGFDIKMPDMKELSNLIANSVKIKDNYVSADPFEKGIRKALNLGHTIGHAFESLAMKRGKPILHGYAVAFGLVVELYLSYLKHGFNINSVHRVKDYIDDIYSVFDFNLSDFDDLHEIMMHDKKNRNGQINFALLSKAGKVVIDVNCHREEIREALEFYTT
ncbi:MAG: 3-dehydroquinate synthase [Cytophagaceae bacterium]|jgi:3-dehydroquinate synthase|nr:3-dehydroquinate synthase [Cytophagaceae bacterium]